MELFVLWVKTSQLKTDFLEVMSKSNYFLYNDTDCKFNKVFDYPRSELSKVNRDKLESNQSTCCYSLSNEEFYIIYNFMEENLGKGIIINKIFYITIYYDDSKKLEILVLILMFLKIKY